MNKGKKRDYRDLVDHATSQMDTIEGLLERAAGMSGAQFESTMGKVEMLGWDVDDTLRKVVGM